jgi:protein TonB
MNASTIKRPAKKFSLSIGALVSIVFHGILFVVLVYLVVPEARVALPPRKQAVIDLVPPPPPPPPPPKIEPPKEPPKIVPKPTPVAKPPPTPPVTSNAPVEAPAISVPPAPPPAPPAPPAPVAPPAPAVGKLVSAEVFSELSTLFSRLWVYPRASQANEEEGTVVLRLLIARDGTILGIDIVKSSGFVGLDKAAKETFRRAGKTKPIAADIQPGTNQFIVEIPINMKLE